MLVELSKVEQRYEAVLAVQRDGLKVTEVAEAFGVSRQTVHSWLARYEAGGLAALADRSHRPRTCPHAMAPAVEARLCELRMQHPGWGPTRLAHQLARERVEPLPSRSAVYRALVRHGLIEPTARRRRLADYRRWERGRPMELWQMDVVGGVVLADGTECKVLTGIDDHSRYCVAAGVMTRAVARSVCAVLAESLRRHGVPEEILTDNGKVFTNRFGLRPTEVLFDRICRENGIAHRLTAPRSPTTTGKIERFHRTLRFEFLTGRVFEDLASAQRELDAWVADYNDNRPHQGIGMCTPAQRFHARQETTSSLPVDLRSLDDARAGDDWISRRVAANGVISVAWQAFSVGKHRGGEVVDVHVTDTLLEVWSGAELVKTVVRTSKGGIRKKRAQAR
ncbi:MAG: IS481 family transposase [Actinobacteria bacterium]|nr:IS481 family transposase [Actinomycetota bacterium]